MDKFCHFHKKIPYVRNEIPIFTWKSVPYTRFSLIVIPLYAEIFDCNLNTANQMDENRPL